ncbi:MAG: PAS domain S-box protein [Chlorobiaceae bacterium]|nr:PAS domain S-box protein [Chlorobiaceae bacterium]
MTSIILDNMNEAVILLDRENLVEMMNAAAEKLTGWQISDAEFRMLEVVLNLPHLKKKPVAGDCLSRFIAEKTSNGIAEFESEIFTRNGTALPIAGKIIPFRHADKPGGSLLMFHETSRPKSAPCLLCSLFNSIPESLFLLDRQGVILEANDTFASRFGRHHEDCIGISVYDLFSPEKARERELKIEEVVRTGKRVTFESEDKGIWRVHNISPVLDAEGEVRQFVVYSVDITALKEAGEELLKTQRYLDADYRAMLKLHDISMLFVREGNLEEIFKKVIDTAMEITGADMGNIRLVDPKTGHLKIIEQRGFEHPLREVCDYSDVGSCLCDMALKRNQRIVIEDITKYPLADNRTEIEEHITAGVKSIQSTPLKSRNGELLGILSVYFRTTCTADERLSTLLELLANQTADIIERAEKEEVLRQSEEHRRLAQDAAKSGSWCWDLTTNRSVWSEELWALYGLEQGSCEPLYETWISSIHPDYRDQVEQKVQEAAREGTELQVEWLVRNNEGGERWIMSRGRPICNASGKPVKMIGIVMDVTDRKMTEKHLIESIERHRSLFNNTLNGVAYCRMIFENGEPVDFVHEEVNSQFTLLTGLTDLEGRKASEVIPGLRETNPAFFEKLGKVVTTGIPDRFEMYFEMLDMWLDIMAYRHKEGCFVALFDVITERKKTETALLESERKFRSITEQMSEVVFVIDSAGMVTYVSEAVEKMFGYRNKEEVSGLPFTEFIAEQEITRAMEIFRTTLENESADRVLEIQLKRKNGSHFFGEVHIRNYRDSKLPGVIGLIRDVTERRNNENKRREYEQILLESRQFLQSIYDAVSYSIFVIDVLQGGIFRFRGINRNHEINTGFSDDEVAGKTPEELFEPETATVMKRHLEYCIEKGRPVQTLEHLPIKGKDTIWETNLTPLRNDAGYIYRIIGTSSNITERKLAEDELKRLSVAVQQSPAVVVITDPEGNIEYINPTFTKHTGYTLDEVKGQNPRVLQSGMMAKEVYENLWETILSGNVWYGEFHNKKKNGDLYWEEAVVSAIRNEEGAITNYVAVKEDITEKKKLWSDLVAAKEKAEESDRLKSAFLANISHEIRTPMNGILGFSELLKEPHLSGEEQQEYIDLIQLSGERMLSLINDLIDISRIEAGETMLQIAQTPINGLLHELFAFFKPQAENRGLQLNCITGLRDSDCIIETDSTKLNQVMTNLIQNALKFTSEGHIDFGYAIHGSTIEFFVRDTGIGIPPEMQDRVFDRFRQLDNSLTRNHEGSGLGLCISRAYVEMLGGTIRVVPVEGPGSRFIFTLPYNPPKSPSSPCEQTADIVVEPAVPPPSLTILIAEDDEVSRLLLKKIFSGENIRILFALTGTEAVEMVEKHPEIDVVLMDIKMPQLNGYDATRLIKQKRPELAVIAQTAFSMTDERKKAMEAGCDGFIVKPVKKHELLELMKELLIL